MARSRITHPILDSSAIAHDKRDEITVNELELDPSKWSNEKKQRMQRIAWILNDFDEGEKN